MYRKPPCKKYNCTMPADSKVEHHLPHNGFALDGRRFVGWRAGDQPEEHLPPKERASRKEGSMFSAWKVGISH